jgi:hypothetical protein
LPAVVPKAINHFSLCLSKDIGFVEMSKYGGVEDWQGSVPAGYLRGGEAAGGGGGGGGPNIIQLNNGSTQGFVTGGNLGLSVVARYNTSTDITAQVRTTHVVFELTVQVFAGGASTQNQTIPIAQYIGLFDGLPDVYKFRGSMFSGASTQGLFEATIDSGVGITVLSQAVPSGDYRATFSMSWVNSTSV